MLTVSEHDQGTSEATWLASDLLARLAPISWGRPRRVVVVAPHPDDEVLGVGGGLRQLADRGATIEVVAVTDGEGSHPGTTAVSPTELARRRRAETELGLGRLGLDATVHHLGVPDGEATLHQRGLVECIGHHLDPTTICLATWCRDGHPDHDAVGRAALAVARASGARLIAYPIWMWHWARPDDTAVPWAAARRVELDDEDVARKHLAIESFRSQIHPLGPAAADQPILPELVLRRFRRAFEVVFEVGTI